MKKIGILTLNGNFNFGNRLQNYALEKFLNLNNYKAETIYKKTYKDYIKFFIEHIINYKKLKRYNNFKKFTNQYIHLKHYKKYELNYNYIIVGSDQVWSPEIGLKKSVMFLPFSNKEKNIAYAASFGMDKIPNEIKEFYKKGLKNFNNISVREEQGKKIINELLPNKNVAVTLDPTLLLPKEEWDKVSKMPKMLNTDKYILMYFLGKVSQKRKDEINRIAKKNNCEIINILDPKSSYYTCGPSEFLYLEKNAFLICTDSFHSCVFGLIYNRPFVVFDREDNLANMNSRIETLINTFQLENRKYNDHQITKDNLNHNYDKAYKILKKEQKKSIEFLKNALKY